MKKFQLLTVLVVISICSLSSASMAKPQASTTQDSETGNILFVFDEKNSIQIAESKADTAFLACSAKQAGAIRYNASLRNIEMCDGDKWLNFVLQSDTCNAAYVGKVRYNATIKNFEHCNGTQWALISNAPMSADAAGAACTANYVGISRYNTNIQDLEVCNGANWKQLGTAAKVSVDYPSCLTTYDGQYTWNSYYVQFGAPVLANTNLFCPKDYVMVATDSNSVSNIACCKLKFD